MRHGVRTSKLNKDTSHRKATIKNLAISLIQYEYINTTDAKAKAVLPMLDKLIKIGKEQSVLARRKLNKELNNEIATKKVLDVLADRYKDKKSGFASIVKIGSRKGDNAEIVRVLLLEN